MSGKHQGEGQRRHDMSRLELWLSHPTDVKLKQRHPTGATSFLIKRPVQFSRCIMWAEVRPGVTKGDAPSLCPSLLVMVLHRGPRGRGWGSRALWVRLRGQAICLSFISESDRVLRWVWQAVSWWPCSLWVITQNCLDRWDFSPSRKGWPHWLSPAHQSRWHLSPWSWFKSEKWGAQKKNISSGALGREHTWQRGRWCGQVRADGRGMCHWQMWGGCQMGTVLTLTKLSFSRELVFLFSQGAERIQKKIDEQLFFFF